MDRSNPEDLIDSFTFELLRSGHMVSELTGSLIEQLSADAYPDEDPAAVVLEMISGTIEPFSASMRQRRWNEPPG